MNTMKESNAQELFIVWIDKKIFNTENKNYLKQLGYDFNKLSKKSNNFPYQETNKDLPNNIKDIQDKNLPYITEAFQDVKESINFLTDNKNNEYWFKKTIIIVSGKLFGDFVKEFQRNLKGLYIIPKIIIFTNRNFEAPKNISNKNFYTSGGYKTNFSEIKNFLDSEVEKMGKYPQNPIQLSTDLVKPKNEDELLFDKVEDISYLALQMYFKMYLDLSSFDDNSGFINYLYNKYGHNSHYYELLEQILSIQDIPIELLSKYYIRLYTIEGDFYKNMKIELLANVKDNEFKYKPFIKTLYGGLESGALEKCTNQKLYSAQFFSEEQIKFLKECQMNKKENLPMSTLFARAFISFSKKLEIAKSFLNDPKKKKMPF